MDEGQLLAYPELLRTGAVPNLDFEHSYGPANLWLLAQVFSVLWPSVLIERAVGLAYRLAVIAAIYRFALVLRSSQDSIASREASRLHASHVASIAAVTTAAFMVPCGVFAFAWFGAIACALWGQHCLLCAATVQGSGTRWLVFAGLLAGIAVTYRVDLAPAIVLSSLPILWDAPNRTRRIYIASLFTALLPLALHIARIGLPNAWQTMFVETVLWAAPGRSLPIPPHGLQAAYFFFSALLSIATLSVLGVWIFRSSVRSAVTRTWLSLAVLSTLMSSQLLQRADSLHAAGAACVALPLVPVAVHFLWPERARIYGVVATVAAVVALVSMAGRLKPSDAHWFVHKGRSFPLEAEIARDLRPVLETLQTRSTDGNKLFVGPRDLRRTNYGDTFIYFLMPELVPASYFTEMNPDVANRNDSPLATELMNADFLVLSRRFDNWKEPNRSARLGSGAASRVVNERFCSVLISGSFELLERCDRLSR